MTGAKTATASSGYLSGHCHHPDGHGRCRGGYGGTACTCPCHDEPPPEPEPSLLTVGDRVTCSPGTQWAGEDLTGAELEIIEVHPYPANVGGPVFVCRWPGMTTTTGACLEADQLGGAA